MVARRGQLTVRGSAKALASGGYGDTIKLKNETSREIYSAVVVGQKTVEVRDTSRTASVRTDAMLPSYALTEARP